MGKVGGSVQFPFLILILILILIPRGPRGRKRIKNKIKIKNKTGHHRTARLTACKNRMTPPDISSAASRLCAACGMCCNGVLFDIVRLQPGDSPKGLAALGLKVKRKRGQGHFMQPCPAHCGSECSIYASRPERCRVFECRQLQRVAAGEITEATALEKIGAARRLVAEIHALLLRAGGTNAKHALAKRCANALAEPPNPSDETVTESRALLTRAKQNLDALLDQEFRIAEVA